MKKTSLVCIALLLFIGMMCDCAFAQLPDDFPELTINEYGETAPGFIYGKFKSDNPLVGEYFMILDNSGTPVFYSQTQTLGEPVCNGLFKFSEGIEGLSKKCTWHLQDDSFNDVDTFEAGNGYYADSHDFQILPNGHALILIYDKQVVDMSKIVPGGHPAANITGSVIQELDVNKNVIFQWRSWDHIPITDTYQDPTKGGFDYTHVNSVDFDVTDGNIIMSCRSTSEVIKISRVTGEVMWRLSGKNNDFTFVNDEENAPRYFKYQHDARRHANGTLSLFDNGFNRNDKARQYSRAVEYDLDEENKTATMVWEYRNDPDFGALNKGQVIRMDNGNSIIHWGGAAVAGDAPAMSEVDASGQLVYELWPAQEGVTVDSPTGQFDRIVWPLSDQAINATHYEIMEGNTYPFDGDATGVELEVNSFVGDGYNEVHVKREPFAPLYPMFAGKAPRVLPVRIAITESWLDSMNADLVLDAVSFGFADSSGQFGYVNPDDLTIYYRSTIGSGLFAPLSTTYNPVKQELQATMPSTITGFGEFIIGFPDLVEVANAPLLIEPADQSTVNQELPVSFFWTPRGFASWNHLQVATDENFTALVVDQPWMSESRYTWSLPAPNTTYYYRVKITNDAGDSDWSTGSFQTVAPMIDMTVPAGGEKWQRGLDSFILWEDNIDEDVVIDLYKDGAFLRAIDTVSSTGVYEWQVDLDLEPGCDYSIKIKSSTDETLSDMSDGVFSIDVPEGDFDCNGCVAMDDYAVLSGQWRKSQSGLAADLDGDDNVDLNDLALFFENWVTSCP